MGSLQETGLSSQPTSARRSAPVSLLDQLSVEDPPREAFPSVGNLHDPVLRTSLGRPVCKPSSQIGGGSFAYHTQGVASHSLCSQHNHLALASFLFTRALWCRFFSAGYLFALCPPARSCRFFPVDSARSCGSFSRATWRMNIKIYQLRFFPGYALLLTF